MSHVAEGKCKILDLDSLAMACDQLGLELVRGCQTWQWYQSFLNDWSNKDRAAALRGFDEKQFGHGEHMIRRKGDVNGAHYEIGVIKARDGVGYELLYDSYGSGGRYVEEIAGKDCEKLADEYNLATAMRTLARQGHRVRRTVNEDGELQLVATKN